MLKHPVNTIFSTHFNITTVSMAVKWLERSRCAKLESWFSFISANISQYLADPGTFVGSSSELKISYRIERGKKTAKHGGAIERGN